jgi:hypothetical protein
MLATHLLRLTGTPPDTLSYTRALPRDNNRGLVALVVSAVAGDVSSNPTGAVEAEQFLRKHQAFAARDALLRASPRVAQ